MDTVPLMLLALHLLALGVVTIIFLGIIILHRRARSLRQTAQTGNDLLSAEPGLTARPTSWLSIRSSNPKAVQAALGVGRSTPCSWKEGMTGEHDFFIGSPVNNWIIVTGFGLPQPDHDVDHCFHFLIRLSRVLGHVQFFAADPIMRHHAWVRVESGIVRRAYAWTGKTVWNQGTKSLAEMELNMKCFGYAEETWMSHLARDSAAANVEKVLLLAERWGINPLALAGNLHNPADGVAGK